MALHLVTGYAGTEHVTSADQGAYYMGTFGEGQFVLNRGAKFAATVVSNNSVSIADGEALMQGRFIKMTMGTSESVSIDNGTSGMKRNDLIVIRYSKNAGTGIETAALAVIKGTPDATTPVDPEYTEGDITDGTDLVNDMPLYRVSLDGINIASVNPMFEIRNPASQLINPEWDFIGEVSASVDSAATSKLATLGEKTLSEVQQLYRAFVICVYHQSSTLTSILDLLSGDVLPLEGLSLGTFTYTDLYNKYIWSNSDNSVSILINSSTSVTLTLPIFMRRCRLYYSTSGSMGAGFYITISSATRVFSNTSTGFNAVVKVFGIKK